MKAVRDLVTFLFPFIVAVLVVIGTADRAGAVSSAGSTNTGVYVTGETQTLLVSLRNPGSEITVDVYVAIMLPDGRLFFVEYNISDGSYSFHTGSVNNTSTWTPCVTGLTLSSGSSLSNFQLLQYTFTGGEPAGTYTWYTVLTTPGTTDIIGTYCPRSFVLNPGGGLIGTWELISASHMLDVDNDGDMDVVIGFQGESTQTSDILLLNDGTGSFSLKDNALPDHYLGKDGSTVNFESADFNGDGNLDIIATTVDARSEIFYKTAQLHLYLGFGDGTFSDATGNISDSLLTQWPEWIRVGDFDLDGNTDFVLTVSGCSDTCIGGRIYLNDGSCNFAPATVTSTDAQWTYVDDKLVWENDGNVQDWGQGSLRFALDVFVGDVNNDGKLDLVAPNGYANGAIATFINNSTPGNLNFNIVYTVQLDEYGDPWDTTGFKNGALLDIDGDGYLDMVGSKSIGWKEDTTEPVYAFINNGDGSFVEDNSVFLPSQPGVQHARQWLVADFDQDGFNDLFVADHGWDYSPFPGEKNLLLGNNGTGNLVNVTSTNLSNASTFTHGASVGDINGDSYPDLFLNNSHQSGGVDAVREERLWLNNGDGSFSPVPSILP